MDKNQLTEVSKHISYLLRHEPASGDLNMDSGGWVKTDELIDALRKHYPQFDRALLERIVGEDSKQRYLLVDHHIRAQQGHSVSIDNVGEVSTPPDLLYHGTTLDRWVEIQSIGKILPMKRNHVHLSTGVSAAQEVAGRRKTKATVILTIQALRMSQQGFLFCISGNGIWLTEVVPTEFVYPVEV